MSGIGLLRPTSDKVSQRVATDAQEAVPYGKPSSSLKENYFDAPLAATIFLSILATIVLLLLPTGVDTLEQAESAGILAIIGLLVAVPAVIASCILLYRWWACLPVDWRQTTPGKAVGLCFIPIFNLYWFFVAYAGLASDLNRYIDAHRPGSSHTSVGLAIAYAIVSASSFIFLGNPVISNVLAVAGLVFFIPLALSITRTCKSVIGYRSEEV